MDVADLIRDGQPELYLYSQTAGSKPTTALTAYAVASGDQLLPITLPALSGAIADNYQGNDAFQIAENCLARRFPMNRSSPSKLQSSTGYRQIFYSLLRGEAGWILRPSSSVEL